MAPYGNNLNNESKGRMRPLPLEIHKRQKTSAGPVLKQNLFCRHRTRPALVDCVLYAEHRLFSYSIHLQSHPPLCAYGFTGGSGPLTYYLFSDLILIVPHHLLRLFSGILRNRAPRLKIILREIRTAASLADRLLHSHLTGSEGLMFDQSRSWIKTSDKT